MSPPAEREVLSIGGREVAISNPDKVLFPGPGTRSSISCATTSPWPRARCAAPAAGPTCSCAIPTASAASSSTRSARRCRARRGSRSWRCAFRRAAAPRRSCRATPRRCVDGQPGLPRAAPASGARRRSRSPRRAARRSRPGAGRGVGPAARGRAGRARDARRLRARRLAEDVGLARHARLRAHRAALDVSRRCAAPRWRWRARSSGARRRWRRASGGRKSGTASSSTTTRTPRTARSPAPTRCGPRPTRACRRR